jgi:mannosyltransferase
VALIDQRAPEPAGPGPAVEPVADRRADPRLRGLVLGAGAIAVAMWMVAMTWGWQLDETLTAWVTGDGFGDAVSRAQEYQGQSPLSFAGLWFWRQIVGDSEFWLRVPSAIAVIAGAWHVLQLGRAWDRDATGWIAAGMFLTTVNIATRATTARPYAFLVLLAVWSMRLLWRWVRTGEQRPAYGWAVSTAAMLYLSPFAAVVLVVHAGVLLAHRRTVWSTAARAVPLAVLLAVPLLPQLASLAGRASTLVTSTQPSPGQALIDVVPLGALLVVGAALVLRRRDDPWPREPALIAGAWAFVPPLLLLIAGVVTGDALWVSRYWVAATPGLALLAGMAIARVESPAGRVPRSVILTAVLMLQGLLAMFASRADHQQSWREAIEWARSEVVDEEALTLISSGLVEALDPDEVADPDSFAYLSAPAHVYGLAEPIRPLPLGRASTAEAFLAEMDLDAATIVLVAPPELGIWPDYDRLVAERLELEGYVATDPDPPLDDMVVRVFRKPAG